MLIMKKNVVYIDETSFNLWSYPKKLWLHRSHLHVTIPTSRGSGVTLIGALSNKNGLIYCHLIKDSNTIETFIDFAQALIDCLGKEKVSSSWTI